MPPTVNRLGLQSIQMLKSTKTLNQFGHKTKTIVRRTFNTYNTNNYNTNGSLKSVLGTIRESPNVGWKYAGLAAALGLGGYIAYGASRPSSYVPYQTREMMSNMGGLSFAKVVRSRIMKTYGYLSAGVLLTGATSFILFTRGYGYRVLMANPWVYGLGTMIAAFGAIHLTMSMSYEHNKLGKHIAWGLTNGLIGFSLLGLSTIAGATIIKQAALITGCIVGGMSTAAMVSPNDTFLNMGPYLGVGLGVVIAASLGSMFFPGSTLLMNVSLYGGLGLFGLYTAHDAQRVLHDAQIVENFDPISEQMGLYLDTINIFVRVVQILMLQQKRR